MSHIIINLESIIQILLGMYDLLFLLCLVYCNFIRVLDIMTSKVTLTWVHSINSHLSILTHTISIIQWHTCKISTTWSFLAFSSSNIYWWADLGVSPIEHLMSCKNVTLWNIVGCGRIHYSIIEELKHLVIPLVPNDCRNH